MEPSKEDLQLQAMIHYIAWDRMLGTLENYPLKLRGAQGLADDVPVLKKFAHIMQDFCSAQMGSEQFDALYKQAHDVVLGMAEEANRK